MKLMKDLCNITAQWARDCSLTIHPGKTKVVSLHCNLSPTIVIEGQRINCSTDATYLGFTLDRRLKGREHLQQRISKGKQKVQATLAALHRLPKT